MARFTILAATLLAGTLTATGCSPDADPAALSGAESPPASFATAQSGCTAPAWDVAIAYDRGAVVSHSGHEWRAKKANTGIAPSSHPAYWGDLGACGIEPPPPPPGPAQLAVFGVWHAGNEYASWRTPRTIADFDAANHWLIDRGDGSGKPSVNLVVLSFLQPLEVLNLTTEANPAAGVPAGMTQEIVDYFKAAGIRVMMSIGGVTYTDYWNQALASNPAQLGLNAAAIARHFGVGIEIDYEQNTDLNLTGLQSFIAAYRSVLPYDATGANHAARLTIDLAAGGRYLQALNRHATLYWLDPANPVLDYANAMVARSSGTPANWQEHIDGMPTYAPPIPPKAPAKLTGGLYLKGDMANCKDYANSEQKKYADYVMTVPPNGAGTTSGMLGFMFWAAERPSARAGYTATTPPNMCEGGMGAAAKAFDIPLPMLALRQQ